MRGRPRPLLALLVALLAALVLGSVFAFGVLATANLRARSAPSGPVANQLQAVSSAPPERVQQVHEVLHRIGDLCRSTGDESRPALVASGVDVIVSFVRQFPEGSFPIDDETGTTLSLLLVTREALRTCDPVSAARVDQELPPEFQERHPTAP